MTREEFEAATKVNPDGTFRWVWWGMMVLLLAGIFVATVVGVVHSERTDTPRVVCTGCQPGQVGQTGDLRE